MFSKAVGQPECIIRRRSMKLRSNSALGSNPEAEWYKSRKFTVVVDAGSSGSRVLIYSWRDPAHEVEVRQRQGLPLNVLPTVEKGTWEGSPDRWQLKIEPGLSSFANNPAGVRDYIYHMIEFARKAIPRYAHADTSVHILATAGMRLVPKQQRDKILSHACAALRSSPFKVDGSSCGDQVQVITGEEEGLLGWISINYLMDGFTTNESDNADGSSTFGFLDMGGASTQIAFEPEDAMDTINFATTGKVSGKQHKGLLDVAFQRLDFSKVNHKVFTTTFLGFGTNAARSRFVSSLVDQESNIEGKIPDPCLPRGLEQLHTNTTLLGSGDFTQCVAMLAPLLNKDASCTNPPCLFHGVHVPNIDFSSSRFIGISEYWYSAHDIFDLGGVYDYNKFREAAAAFCSEEWSILEKKLRNNAYKPQVTRDRLQMQCFKAAWVTNVLHEGIGMPRPGDAEISDGRDHAAELPSKAGGRNIFQSINDVHGLGVSWTLGRAILEANNDVSVLATAISTASFSSPLTKLHFGELLPVMAACAVVIVLIVTLLMSRKWVKVENVSKKLRRNTGNILPSFMQSAIPNTSSAQSQSSKRNSSSTSLQCIVTEGRSGSPTFYPLTRTPGVSSVRESLSGGLVSRATSPLMFNTPRENSNPIRRSASPSMMRGDLYDLSPQALVVPRSLYPRKMSPTNSPISGNDCM